MPRKPKAPARVAIPRSVRFEVFKRDRFTCQYCGGKAPDVVLHCDHMKPVAEGGGNDMMNLVTSCQPCNSGKGKRRIDDMTVIERQRRQIEELEERRAQLEMMLQWRDGLATLDADKVEAIVAHICAKSDLGPNENGRQHIRRWLAKYTLDAIFSAIDEAFARNLTFDAKGKADPVAWEQAFARVPSVISTTGLYEKKPYMRQLFYARGILRNRFPGFNELGLMGALERVYLAGVSLDDLLDLAKTARNIGQVYDAIEAVK